MGTRICFAYPWATFGGCERVFINRAIAFKKYLPEVQVHFFFLSDGGGLESFRSAINKYDLESVASIVSSLDKPYDIISIVDCPQLIHQIKTTQQRYFVECHTGYTENRRYLSNLPLDCKVVATPSSRFCGVVRDEYPTLTASVLELCNFVPWDIKEYHTHNDIALPEWSRRPILFLGRMDKLKNPLELLDAFKIIESRRPGEFMLLLCGPKSFEIDIDRAIEERGLGGVAVVMPPIPFHATSSLIEAVRMAKGIFVSPSQAESFGLSAAEAISTLLPPVLSDIGAHLDLVDDAADIFTYPLGDIHSLASRIEYVFDNHSGMHGILRLLRDKFSATRFIANWERLLIELGE